MDLFDFYREMSHCEERSDEAIHRERDCFDPLKRDFASLNFARNDNKTSIIVQFVIQ